MDEPAVLGLDHVTITTPEELEEEVVAFYADGLGLQRIDKPEGSRERGAWFVAGDQEVHVSIDMHNPPEVAHFGLVVRDYREMVERLRQIRCHIEQAREISGRHRFFIRDPAGNRVEILSYDG